MAMGPTLWGAVVRAVGRDGSGRAEERVMKLYIWEGDGVLQDWTSGMIVALAEDLEGALAAVRQECDWCMHSFPNDKPTRVIDLGVCSAKPKRMAAVVYGGG